MARQVEAMQSLSFKAANNELATLVAIEILARPESARDHTFRMHNVLRLLARDLSAKGAL